MPRRHDFDDHDLHLIRETRYQDIGCFILRKIQWQNQNDTARHSLSSFLFRVDLILYMFCRGGVELLVPAGRPGAPRSVPIRPDDRVLRSRLHHGDRYLGESGTGSLRRGGGQ